MAEAILNKVGYPRFSAYSAGSHPTGVINSLTIELLESMHYPVNILRSKSWEEFSNTHSPHFDIVITVCDSAAAETCPVWPEKPLKAHWSLPDPAVVKGSRLDQFKAFASIYQVLEQRIQHLIKLPLIYVGREGLRKHLEDIEKEKILEYGNTP